MAAHKERPFVTIKLFGEKAQKLLANARSRIKSAKKSEDNSRQFPKDPRVDSEALTIDFSISGVVKAAFAILAVVLFVYLSYHLRDKLFLLFFAVFLAVVIDPSVSFLERMRIPRGFSIVLVYLVALTLLLFLIISLIPIIADQIQLMANNLGESIDKFLADPTLVFPFASPEINASLNGMLREFLADFYTGGILQSMQQFGQQFSNAAQGSILFIVDIAGSVVQFVVKFILVLVLCFFFQIQKEGILRWARVLLPYRFRRYADAKAEAIHAKLALWIRGQIVLSFSIGLLVFIALTILKMPYALTLAVLAFFAEFIPVVGPIIAAIPSIFIAVAQFGFFPALIVGVVYYGIQWCENNLLVPLIMHRAVGLSPIAIIFAMLVGISFPKTIHPVLGVLLAVPVATIFSIFIQDYRDWRGENDD
ncbi:MAG TPA: AI-2E family transporter [Candidatus Peribacterales bacterium]|nr:AI-2E family transporter [Candidatus Peribacterales bacterium]